MGHGTATALTTRQPPSLGRQPAGKSRCCTPAMQQTQRARTERDTSDCQWKRKKQAMSRTPELVSMLTDLGASSAPPQVPHGTKTPWRLDALAALPMVRRRKAQARGVVWYCECDALRCAACCGAVVVVGCALVVSVWFSLRITVGPHPPLAGGRDVHTLTR